MSIVLERPPAAPPAPGTAPPPPARPLQRNEILAAVIALAVTACLPFTQVYMGLDWMWLVVAAALLAIGIAWACRRLGLGPVGALVASVTGWLGFVVIAFLGDTLAGGVVPTSHTLRGVAELWVRGTELVRLRPSPALAEPGLLLLSVTGVWAVAYTIEGMVFALAAPVQALIMALALWITPLAIAKPGGYAWVLAAAFLAASAWLLLACAWADLARWGPRAGAAQPRNGPRGARSIALVIAATAIGAGVLLARLLPGAADPPWLQLRSPPSPTLTSNPIVGLKARLVSQDTRPVLHVHSPRPVYLRITALDVYDGQREEWTSAGIHGVPVSGPLPNQEAATVFEKAVVSVTVGNVGPEAVLVPAPYLPVSVAGPASEKLQYDPRVATFTLDRDTVLAPGDQYEVTAAIPALPSVMPNSASGEPQGGGPETQLPGRIPSQVGQLASGISRKAGAVTPLEQALAIQEELRTWTYSLAPAPGHGGSAMALFLEARAGYCEQFAGTMAMMLRTLGIPARVAVGFTPGTPDATGEFVVTNANAHAWVEARFPGLGWIAFEPTPRSDGNVLVPSAANLAPRLLQGQPQDASAPGGQGPAGQLPEPAQPMDRPQHSPQPGIPPQPPEAPRDSRLPLQPMLLALALVALTAGAMAGRRHVRAGASTPADRVLHARARVQRLGRGLGAHPLATQTDREYFDLLATIGSVPRVPPGIPASERLARATAAACYAPMVTEADAEAAERAAADLRRDLLDSLPVSHRLAAIVRGGVWTALRALAALTRAAARRPDSGGRRRGVGRRG